MLTNEMKLLCPSYYNSYIWKLLKTKGMPPLPRYQHTMNFYAPSRILVIYGGKDDSRNVNNFPAFYSNLAVFDLTHFIWLTI